MPGHREDSDSSCSDSSHSDSSSHSSNHHQPSFDSSCGIRSLNEYIDKGLDKDEKTAQSHTKAGDTSKAWAGAKATDHNNGHFSSSAYAGAEALSQDGHELHKVGAEASAEFGLGGAIAEAGADYASYTYGDSGGKIEVAKGYTGVGVGAGLGGVKAKAEAGVDLVNTTAKISDNQEVNVNVGLNANTGVEAGIDGVGVSLLGFGFGVGRNTGISTPFGGISFKLW